MNLIYELSSTDLEQLPSQHGTVLTVNIITDDTTGRSKGFGFVEMASEAEAQAAIDTLNGQEHSGRKLVVSEANPRQPRVGGNGRPRG